MKNKTFGLFVLTLIVMAFAVAGVSAAALSQWTLTTPSPSAPANGTADIVDANVIASSLTVPGATAVNNDASGFHSTGWPTPSDATHYIQVSLSPKTSFNFFTVSSLSFNVISAAGTGPTNITAEYSTDGATFTPLTLTVGTNLNTGSSILISAVLPNVLVDQGQTISFKFFVSGGVGDFAINTIKIQGTPLPDKLATCISSGTPSLNPGNLALSIDSTSVDSGLGNSDGWFPLDTIKARVTVDNNGADKYKNIVVNWGLYDKLNNKWVISGKENSFSLKDGSSQSTDFTFQIDNVNRLLKSGKVVFYSWATGEDSVTPTTTKSCVLDSQAVDSVQESDFVILNNIQSPVNPNYAQCGQVATVTADMWNIGTSDESGVYILASSPQIGINNQRIDVGSISSAQSTPLSFTFTVPKGTPEKTYPIQFTIYDDRSNVFQAAFNNKKAIFNTVIDVKGNCAIVSTAAVSATLQSGTKAGDQFVVKATVTNNGSSKADYTVGTQGYTSWASTAVADIPTFTLNAGQSKDVTFTMQSKDSSQGSQTFDIQVASGGQVVLTQPVSVTVESSGFLSSITGGAIGSNGSIWLIGILNAILVIAIIFVAIRALRK